MRTTDPNKPHKRPSPSFVTFGGRQYPLLWEPSGWRLRSKAKSHPADFRTKTLNLRLAQQSARAWLERHADDPIVSRKGGGTLAAVVKIYLETPKKTKANVASDNVSRLRAVCRLALDKGLEEVTCREINADFWQTYQRAALARAGRQFDLVTRYRENIAVNSAVRAARCVFLPALVRAYRAAGLDVHRDAGAAVMLPEPYVPPSVADDASLETAWAALTDRELWLTVGLARYAGLRREEISNCRVGWIEETGGVVSIALRDRPEEGWWTKTGKPYRAQVISPALSDWLLAMRKDGPPDKLIVSDPTNGEDRSRWFERVPQAWLRENGVKSGKPLHRLRGLYADHIATLTSDAVTARLAAIREAQKNLGHTSSATTEAHYLTPQ